MECHSLSWAPGLKRWDLLIPLHCRCKPGLQRKMVCTWISKRNIYKKKETLLASTFYMCNAYSSECESSRKTLLSQGDQNTWVENIEMVYKHMKIVCAH